MKMRYPRFTLVELVYRAVWLIPVLIVMYGMGALNAFIISLFFERSWGVILMAVTINIVSNIIWIVYWIRKLFAVPVED